MKVLLTGAAGFVGSHVADALLARQDQVIAVDNFNDYYSPSRKERNIATAIENPNYKLVRADIRDFEAMEQIIMREQPDKICHLAAMANPRYSVKYPLLYEEVNLKGTLNLLELAKLHGIQHFVFASSSSVYGNSTPVPFSELASADQPLSPYGASKRSAELMAHSYHHLHSMPITCLRFFTAYGPRNRPDMAVYLFTKAIDLGEPINLFGDGSARRDWTYIADTVQGVLAALDRPFEWEIINLGNSHTHTEMDLIHTAEHALGKSANLIHLPRPATEPSITYSDISKAQRLLDFAPATSFEQGYALFFDWYWQECR